MQKVLTLCGLLMIVSGCQPAPMTQYQQPAALPKPTPHIENGFYTRAYDDGSGSVHINPDDYKDGWSISCHIDKMNDKRKCLIRYAIVNEGGPEVIYGHSASPQWVCIQDHDFPGRTGMIRIDKNAPIRTDEEGCVPASKILPKMKSGTTIYTRYVKWPYDYDRDSEYPLAGFSQALKVVEDIRNGKVY